MIEATGRTDPVIIDNHADVDRLDNVRSSRILAFLVDAVAITVLTVAAYVVVAVLGILTFGLGWLLFYIVWPAVALLYYFFTLSQTGSTPGMSLLGIELRDSDGSALHPIIGLVHPALFWFMFGVFPLLLISFVVSLLDERKRMLHDMVLRAVMVRRL